jgi:hypothetical protein
MSSSTPRTASSSVTSTGRVSVQRVAAAFPMRRDVDNASAVAGSLVIALAVTTPVNRWFMARVKGHAVVTPTTTDGHTDGTPRSGRGFIVAPSAAGRACLGAHLST